VRQTLRVSRSRVEIRGDRTPDAGRTPRLDRRSWRVRREVRGRAEHRYRARRGERRQLAGRGVLQMVGAGRLKLGGDVRFVARSQLRGMKANPVAELARAAQHRPRLAGAEGRLVAPG